jgi:hypothetical protein
MSAALYLADTSGLFRLLQVDLLISVTAERHRLTVLTDDRDFLTVAAVTGQPVRLVTGTS